MTKSEQGGILVSKSNKNPHKISTLSILEVVMTRLTKRQPHTIRRIISILLVLSHIFVFCLKDMGVVFAEDTQTEQANQEVKTNDSQSADRKSVV